MTESVTGTDRFRAILVLAATVGTIALNWLSATGRMGGVTQAVISEKYPTLVTPAGYAFAIWSLIYVGLTAFSIYQLLPANVARFRSIRSLYIFSCALNCGWIYFWHGDQIAICFGLIIALAIVLFFINYQFHSTESTGEYWLVKAPFGIYFGWVTAAALVNFAILLASLNVHVADWIGVVLILFAGILAIIIRVRLTNYLYPLAIAWAVTAIAVKQSGRTPIVVAAAVTVVACLIATLSLVMNLRSSESP